MIVIGLLLSLVVAADVWSQTTYTVDRLAGNDANPGTVAKPFRSIAKAALVAVRPGDIVRVKGGTYPERVIVAGAGTPQHPIVFKSDPQHAAIITNDIRPQDWPGDHTSTANATRQPYITWQGFMVQGKDSLFQLRAAEGWSLERMTFGSGGQNGVNIRAHRVKIEHSIFEDLLGHAIVAVGSRDLTIRYNQIRRINVSGTYDPAGSAVTKFLETDGLRLEYNLSEQNVGPGLWLDWKNTNYRIRYNTLRQNRGITHDWQGPGLWTEANTGPGLIEHNTITGNTGAGIGILESPRVTVRNNTISGGYTCIEFRNLDRGTPDLRIHHASIQQNTCTKAEAGIKTSIGVWEGFDARLAQVVIDRNRYTLPTTHPIAHWLHTKTFTRAQTCQILGFECTR